MDPILLINNYSQLLKNKKSKELKDVLYQSLAANFDDITYDSKIAGELARVFLGYNAQQLYAILVLGKGEFNATTAKTMKYFIAPFASFKVEAKNTLRLVDFSNPNEISFEAYQKRVEMYLKNCNQFIDEQLDAGTMVQYFEVNIHNFKKNAKNKCVLGLYNETEKNNKNRIDLVTINDAYMDVTRPVPPFKPSF